MKSTNLRKRILDKFRNRKSNFQNDNEIEENDKQEEETETNNEV
ncbi:hypothetical protein RJG79_03625 [Mycoplasmatota bacterium WC44]